MTATRLHAFLVLPRFAFFVAVFLGAAFFAAFLGLAVLVGLVFLLIAFFTLLEVDDDAAAGAEALDEDRETFLPLAPLLLLEREAGDLADFFAAAFLGALRAAFTLGRPAAIFAAAAEVAAQVSAVCCCCCCSNAKEERERQK